MGDLFSGKGPRITVIGGGTGLSVILRGLKRITDNLAAVVTMADDGGSSGMLREDLGMLPPGDVRSCLLALADVEEDFSELMKYRFSDGALSGQNMGNLIIAGLAMMEGSFVKGLEKAHSIFRINGRVIPVTCNEITLCAHLTGGTIVRGESNIPKTVILGEGKIKDVYLEPEGVNTWHDAKDAISNADFIIIGPGSLYTSIIPNFLVGGIVPALKSSNAKIAYICNIMTQRGETDDFTAYNHLEEVIKYMQDIVPDYFLVNSKIIKPDDMNKYNKDGLTQVLLSADDKKKAADIGTELIEEELLEFKMGYIRHDSEAISQIILNLIQRSMCV